MLLIMRDNAMKFISILSLSGYNKSSGGTHSHPPVVAVAIPLRANFRWHEDDLDGRAGNVALVAASSERQFKL